MNRTVVLVGAGHAHLHIARNADAFTSLGIRLVLIDPGTFWYSGLATGMLSGQYERHHDQVDVAGLADRSGAEFIPGKVIGIDRSARRVYLKTGEKLGYDLVSLNVGSRVPPLGIPDDGSVRSFPAKPIALLAELRRELADRLRSTGAMPSVVVIGGGATGVELAANLMGFAERHGVSPRVALVTPAPLLVPQLPGRASQALGTLFQRRGLDLFLGQRVTALEGGEIVTEQMRLPCEIAVLANGLKADPLVEQLGLPASAEGLVVNADLASPEDPEIFAIGDCADFGPRRLPRLGVFGVRAAPVLQHNLLARVTGRAPQAYQPQRVWLSILNLGNGQGLLSWGRFWWRGRSSLRLKEYLDLRFLETYRS
jgi:NADH dehydrogenase FAD-containing subunit